MGKNNSASEIAPVKVSDDDAVHILVIRLSALGDVAMTVPVLRTLVQCYPEVKITVLSKPFFKPLFEGIPNLDFYAAHVKGKHKGIPGLWKLSGELSTLQLHAVADLHNVLRSRILGSFFSMKGLRTVRIDKGRKEKKALTRKTNKRFKPLKPTVQRYADVFEQLGFPVDLSKHRFPPKKELPQKITKTIGSGSKPWIGIAPFAAHAGKTYPKDLMEDAIARLDSTNAYTLIFFGGGKEETEALQTLSKSCKNAVNAAGVFTFEEELALISRLNLMVAMDSGNAHLAAMYGVPAVTLWGVTHPYAGFYPFAQPMDNALLVNRERYPLIPTSVYGNKYPEGYEAAMRSIAPEQVVQKIAEILNRESR